MHPDVDAYLARSTRWPDELAHVRPLLLGCGLTEELKWRQPCYTHDGRNIVILQEMRDFLALMFFQGAALSDPLGVLQEQGPNSRSAKRIIITSVAQIDELAPAIRQCVTEAMALGPGAGSPPPSELVLVEELQDRLDADPALRAAFDALTPGRRRQYHLYVADAKQAATRQARVDKCVPTILAGRGLRD